MNFASDYSDGLKNDESIDRLIDKTMRQLIDKKPARGFAMKNYLLLIKGSFADWNKLPESKRNEIVTKFGVFAKELGGKGYLRGGDGCSERSYRFMTASTTPTESLIPVETKDMITGYFLIEVPNEDEAISIARRCPAFECDEYVELVPCGH